MADRYYVLLYRQTNELITFPIKAPRNEADNQLQFAGGYPAMFGGNAEGRTVDATLAAELAEESRGTLQLTAPVPAQPFYQGQANGDSYFFYWTTRWQATGTPWHPPQNRNEGEMMTIATVSGDEFTAFDPPDEVLRKLIFYSNAPGGSAQQEAEFFNSQTANAFIQFIYGIVEEESAAVAPSEAAV